MRKKKKMATNRKKKEIEELSLDDKLAIVTNLILDYRQEDSKMTRKQLSKKCRKVFGL